MNLFYLDKDHDKNAEYHIDKHVAKMILETCEMICMCHLVDETLGFTPRKLTPDEYRVVIDYKKQFKILLPEQRRTPYIGRDSHLNHPSTIWIRSGMRNYEWAWCYASALESERYYRNGTREHKSFTLCKPLPLPNLPDVSTPFALAMKDFLKVHPQGDDPIEAHRNFYMYDKSDFASWKHRNKPYWWVDEKYNSTKR